MGIGRALTLAKAGQAFEPRAGETPPGEADTEIASFSFRRKQSPPGVPQGKPGSGGWRAGDIAQLVEHLLCKQDVTGSSPVISMGRWLAVQQSRACSSVG